MKVNKKKKNKADLGFLGVLILFFVIVHEKQALEPDGRQEEERCASASRVLGGFTFITV